MPLDDAIDFIEAIEEAERDELIMKRWIPIQFEMSFADFKARLLTLSDVVNGKRPDHILELFGVFKCPLLLSIESKEKSCDLESDVGTKLVTYIKELISYVPSAKRKVFPLVDEWHWGDEQINIYTNAECEVMYDEECGYWTYDVLNRKSPKSGMSMSDEEALKIAKDFVEENELWPEEISNVKTVDQYGLNEDLEYGVDTKSVYFYPQVDGKTVLGRFRISIDVDLTGEIVSVKYMVTPLGESISASLKSRADIAADVKAGDYSASFTQDLSDAQISRCEYGYYADGVAHDGKTYLYPVYILSGEGKTADGSTETFDLIIDAQK